MRGIRTGTDKNPADSWPDLKLALLILMQLIKLFFNPVQLLFGPCIRLEKPDKNRACQKQNTKAE
ncbi:hypothetical protein CEF21_09315 [Bacillus sp. FJAT-42376]|nr:hypothetical protein CEF21_09315 [Bacillus sp. FJAT-42376]